MRWDYFPLGINPVFPGLIIIIIIIITIIIIIIIPFYWKSSQKMFKINNRKVQNKRTGEKFGSEKIIVRYLIRIVERGNLA